MAVAAGVNESDLGVDALDEGVGDAKLDCGEDFFEVDLESLGQSDEGVDAAALAAVIQRRRYWRALPGGWSMR